MNTNQRSGNESTSKISSFIEKTKEAFSIKLIFVVILVALVPIGLQLVIGTSETDTIKAESALEISKAEISLAKNISETRLKDPALNGRELVLFEKEMRLILQDKQEAKEVNERELEKKKGSERNTKIVLQIITLLLGIIGLVLLTKEVEQKFYTFRIGLVLGIFTVTQALAGFFPLLS